ncbi:glutaredoxin family protein [Macrococcus capreoli]|uniref:glutaredoxin family protein n=1 Tax=Macrococcus capreoli TaxID=2982690 RepID=UPI0021D59F01|nr:glutaredoxin family protein [Macrococcus sp. TMW 2.2395]MCU7556327.1 glutaredoxin family protein [Macrococcus sp. TMW 2.2395]
MKDLILYTQPRCGLCNDAKIQIEFAQAQCSFEVKEINILSDDQLNELYCMRVPVLVDAERAFVIQEGQIDFVTIIEYMEQISSK